IIEFFPFNEDLNRLQLIVKNPGADKLKITWGAVSKDYSATDLAKGVNLAADFASSNPFTEPFKKVEDAIRAQQNYETPLIKDMLARWPAYLQMVPEQKESLDKIAQAAIDKEKALNDASVAAVAPVKHTIKIEKLKP